MKLEDHLHHLPKHSVEVNLWDTIDQQLTADTTLADRLPHHKANADLWFDIDDQLRKVTHRLLRLRYISAAASIAVIMTLGTVYFTQSNKENLYFTEKIYIQELPSDELQLHEVNVMENCQDYPAVCNTPDFARLKSSLDQLKREEAKLKSLQKATKDPKMELYHSRIVKNIQQVEAQMIQMFS